MLHVITWWLIVQVFGLAVLPLAFRLFRHLPDRGYALAKPLGLLLVAYLFWLLGMLGFLRNTASSIAFCLVIVAIASAYLYYRQRNDSSSLRDFVRTHWNVILVSEALFLAGFALWALYRAYNPDISATEKPMEFAFLNGILRSERFPPLDPWLSGFAISYYYFGYIMIAVLTRLSGIPSSIAFNLGIALLFAWTLTGAFSVVYNLAAGFREQVCRTQAAAPAAGREGAHSGAAIRFGLLGAWLVAVAGNLEGFFEMLHSRGLVSEAFWNWLDIKNLANATVTGNWYPTDNWWWWRASRVIHDRDFLGNSVEVIDEFPFFSFMLGDMHPHVLALPFVLLAVGLSLNLVLSSRRNEAHPPDENSTLSTLRYTFGEPWWAFVVYAVCIGAIGFLNTWDLPIYFVIMLGAYAIQQRVVSPGRWFTNTLIIGLAMGLLSFILYLPFYISFQSQAGGILPNLLFSTRWQQFAVMFGLQLFILIGFLAAHWGKIWRCAALKARFNLVRDTLALWWGLFLGAFAVMFLLLASLFLTAPGRSFLEGVRNNEAVRQMIGDLPWNELLVRLLAWRLASPWTAFVVALLLAVLVALLLRGLNRLQTDNNEYAYCQVEPTTTFALWLALVGLALVFSVEFIYLRDTFGTRMNTVFKFYYQAWVLLSLGGAYGIFYVFGGAAAHRAHSGPLRRALRSIWTAGLVVLLGVSAVYPVLAGYSKAGEFQGTPTLDGTSYMAGLRPDDYAAIRWLNENVADAPVILEATGGSYTEYARVSSQTGLPTLLGWGGHELQWRGNYDEAGRREPDIEALYSSLDPQLTLTLLDKYGIKYVYVGSLERQKYPPAALAKFDQLLDVAYRNDGVTVYEYRAK